MKLILLPFKDQPLYVRFNPSEPYNFEILDVGGSEDISKKCSARTISEAKHMIALATQEIFDGQEELF